MKTNHYHVLGKVVYYRHIKEYYGTKKGNNHIGLGVTPEIARVDLED